MQRDIKHKERAREALAKKYRNAQLSEEAILWSIYSISDNNSYLLFNRCVRGGGATGRVSWTVLSAHPSCRSYSTTRGVC